MRQFALKKNFRRASFYVCECNERRLRRYFSDGGKKFVFFTEKSGRGSPSVRSYSKNGGTVEGVWIFHRHGELICHECVKNGFICRLNLTFYVIYIYIQVIVHLVDLY